MRWWPTLQPGRERGRFRRFHGKNASGEILLLQVSAYSHDCAAGANSGDESVGCQSFRFELQVKFGAGGLGVCFDIGGVGKLSRQEDIFVFHRHFFRHPNAAEESALLLGHWNDVRTQAMDQVHALAAHPVGHEDGHGVSQRPAYRRKSDAGVSAGGFGDGVSRVQPALGVSPADDVQRHPVLDAAGEVHLLAFGKDGALAARYFVFDSEQRRVADQSFESAETVCNGRGCGGSGGDHKSDI